MSVFDRENPVNEKVLISFGFQEKQADKGIAYVKNIHLYASLVFNPQTSDMFFAYVENKTREIKVVKAGHIDDMIDLECIIDKFHKISWHKN